MHQLARAVGGAKRQQPRAAAGLGTPFQTFNVKIFTNCKGLPARACGRRSREAAAPRRCRRPVPSSTSRCLPLRPPRQSPPQPPLQTTKRTLSLMWQLCHAIVLVAQLHDTARGAGVGALPHSVPYLCLTHRASAHTAAMPAACKRVPTPLNVEESHKRSKLFRIVGRNMSDKGQGKSNGLWRENWFDALSALHSASASSMYVTAAGTAAGAITVHRT